jgi:hypothetical protein
MLTLLALGVYLLYHFMIEKMAIVETCGMLIEKTKE